MPVEVLVVPLIAVGQQTVVAGLRAVFDCVRCSVAVFTGIRIEVEDLHCFTRNSRELSILGGQSPQHSSAAFSGFEEK